MNLIEKITKNPNKKKIENAKNMAENIDITKELITKYNGGRPEKRLFNTQNSKERVLQGLISFNKEDKSNIFIYEELLKKGYIPFAITEFGDLVFINNENKSVGLYLHENETIEKICDKVELFFETLFN